MDPSPLSFSFFVKVQWTRLCVCIWVSCASMQGSVCEGTCGSVFCVCVWSSPSILYLFAVRSIIALFVISKSCRKISSRGRLAKSLAMPKGHRCQPKKTKGNEKDEKSVELSRAYITTETLGISQNLHSTEPEVYPTGHSKTQEHAFANCHLRERMPMGRSLPKLLLTDPANGSNNASSSQKTNPQMQRPNKMNTLKEVHLKEAKAFSFATCPDDICDENIHDVTLGTRTNPRKTKEPQDAAAHLKDDRVPPLPHQYACIYNTNHNVTQSSRLHLTYVKPSQAQRAAWKIKEKRAVYNWAALTMQKMWSFHNGIEHKHSLRGPALLSDGITPGRGQIYTQSWKPPCHWLNAAKHSLCKAWSPCRQTGQMRLLVTDLIKVETRAIVLLFPPALYEED